MDLSMIFFLKKTKFVDCSSTWEGKQVSYLNTCKTFHLETACW